MTLSGVGRIHAIARALHGRFQLIGCGQPLVVLHRGFAGRERYFYSADSGNRLQRVRYLAGAAPASHASYFQKFGLHLDASFQGLNKNYMMMCGAFSGWPRSRAGFVIGNWLSQHPCVDECWGDAAATNFLFFIVLYSDKNGLAADVGLGTLPYNG